jgi:Uma2 family endonuclease
MTVQDRLYTAQDLADMPDDGKIYELHNGVIVEVAGSQKRQTRLAAWIIYLLMKFLEENRIGGAVSGADGTFELNRYNTRIPDVAYVMPSNDQQGDDGFFKGAPDFAVEVLSPSNDPVEMQQRVGEYLTAGTQLIWLVDPEMRTVDVYTPGGLRETYRDDQVLDGGMILPGFKVTVSQIFERVQ